MEERSKIWIVAEAKHISDRNIERVVENKRIHDIEQAQRAARLTKDQPKMINLAKQRSQSIKERMDNDRAAEEEKELLMNAEVEILGED